MRHLRHKLKALSPAILLIPVLCGIISAQSGLTTIQDTLFDADGARYNGTLTIQWSTFDTTNPGTIIQQSKTVQVVNGNLLVQLAPNNTATPPANVYNGSLRERWRSAVQRNMDGASERECADRGTGANRRRRRQQQWRRIGRRTHRRHGNHRIFHHESGL